MIVACRWKADEAANGGEVNNVAFPACAHARQNGLSQGDQTKDVSLEHGANFIILAFFDSGEVTITGVIDQHVDAAELVFRCLDSANYRIFVVYVERQGESTFFVPRDDGLHLLGITRGNRRAPT